MLDDYHNGRPMRYLILKCRQPGISTIVQAFIYWLLCYHPGTAALAAADLTDNTDALYQMQLRFVEHHPRSLLPPVRRRTNRKEIVFAGTESQIRFDTAQKRRLGMSRTIRALHASEVAYWRYPAESLLAAHNAIPDLPGTFIALESTANGYNHFRALWTEAERGAGGYTPLFFAWHHHAEYARPLDVSAKRFAATLDDHEATLRDEHRLTLEQINWRRHTIATRCGGSLDDFNQEYPATPRDAFIVSGSCMFATASLAALEDQVEQHRWAGRVEPLTSPTSKRDPPARFVADPRGPLRVWARPDPEHRYVIGADCSPGIAPRGPGDPGGDWQAALVKNIHTGQHVATWHGRIDPTQYGEALAALGWYYSTALLAIEVNEKGHGLTAALAAQRLGYPNQYYREVQGKRSRETTDSLGWLTSGRTRPVALDALRDAIHSDASGYHDERLLDECRAFVRAGERYEAAGDSHDDLVIAAAITEAVARSAPAPPIGATEPTSLQDILDKHGLEIETEDA